MQDYVYQERAVIFVDVLGFQEKLKEFENDAISKSKGAEYLISPKANQFINTFKKVISLLDEDNFTYYLFSDNICITIDYISNPDLLVNVLFTISELFYAFAQEGYFLRGGVDVGKFVDEKSIALGIPLLNAYLLEQKYAVYPRILISDNYRSKLKEYIDMKRISSASSRNIDYLLNQSCELYYLNVFYNVVRKEDKIDFFANFKNKIKENLDLTQQKEAIHIKYEWLADELNTFIDNYTKEIIFYDDDIEADKNLLDSINAQKIN